MHIHQILPLGLVLSSLCAASKAGFDPRAYSKNTATCKATRRTTEDEHTVVDIHLRYVDINPTAETTLLLVHGWPSLWSTWSNQIQEFKDDYHLIVPDLRGFGESTHPGEARTSGTMPDMVGDMVCILEAAGISSAVCVGHDWGTQICFEAARMRPDIFRGVVGAAIPYLPAAGSYIPKQHLVAVAPKLAYQLFFHEKLPEAVKELEKDIQRTVRATLRTTESPPPDSFLRSTSSFMDAWAGVEEIPPVPFFTPDEEEYFIEQYKIQGFTHTLQFYTEENRLASWTFSNTQGNHTISQPVLSVLPKQDPVADWEMVAQLLKSSDFLPNGIVKMVEGGHWHHIEYPETFNEPMRAWLNEFFGVKSGHDEL
ncbi:Alpha/Beta hydrolase protein [Mycena rebaudengoi]|nr:Alpha/Beta hydrolase protein [Mycena rebaudengoi]